jgi:hypothetical protein
MMMKTIGGLLGSKPGRGRGPFQVGFESGVFSPAIVTGGLGDGQIDVCFLTRIDIGWQ